MVPQTDLRHLNVLTRISPLNLCLISLLIFWGERGRIPLILTDRWHDRQTQQQRPHTIRNKLSSDNGISTAVGPTRHQCHPEPIPPWKITADHRIGSILSYDGDDSTLRGLHLYPRQTHYFEWTTCVQLDRRLSTQQQSAVIAQKSKQCGGNPQQSIGRPTHGGWGAYWCHVHVTDPGTTQQLSMTHNK